MQRKYPSKILLFGEYAILCGGEALAIPDTEFFAEWKWKEEKDASLQKFCAYIKQGNYFIQQLNSDQFQLDLDKGLFLDSTIPSGYGLGSSGALVAAVYDRYAIDPLHQKTNIDLSGLRIFLANMENYYHTKSSGLDPLVSLLQKAIYVQSDGSLSGIDKLPDNNDYTISLIDTNTERKTSDLVKTFHAKMEDPVFNTAVMSEYLPLVSQSIHHYLQNNFSQLKNNIIELSTFQLQYFGFAIPESIEKDWDKSLAAGNNIYKLCGAGGGGFMIRFSFDH